MAWPDNGGFTSPPSTTPATVASGADHLVTCPYCVASSSGCDPCGGAGQVPASSICPHCGDHRGDDYCACEK